MKNIILTMSMALVSVAVSQAGPVSLITSRVGTDLVDWNQLGPDNTPIPNPFSATSVAGLNVTGSFAGGGIGFTSLEGGSWTGNFGIGDALIWTNSPGQGPLTLLLGAAVSQIGAQIQADYFGDFTAQIDAYRGATLVGSFTEAGEGTSLEEGAAIYLGVSNFTGTGPYFDRVVFSLSTAITDAADFAINQVDITAAPEPATWMLLAGSVALAGVARRRLRAR